MNRLLGVFVLAAALSACTSQTPAAQPPSTVTTTTTTTVTTTSPRIDTPRNIAGLDPCTLLTATEFSKFGFPGFGLPPTPYPAIPGSCAFTFGTGKPDDMVVVVTAREASYEDEKAKNAGGHEGVIAGHHVYFYCGGKPEVACAAWATVGPGKLLSVGVNKKGSNEGWLLRATQMSIEATLNRLPKA